MAVIQACAAAPISVPVYSVVPFTLPVQVLPDNVTSPVVAANRDVCNRAIVDTTTSFFMMFLLLVMVLLPLARTITSL